MIAVAVAETAPAADPNAPVKAGVAEIPELGDLAAPVGASALRNPHEINERAGGALLGCPAPTPPSFVPEFSFSETTNPVVVATGGFREVISTTQQVAEAAAFFEDAKTAESAGARQRANRLHGPVFSLMQYRRNARTGQTMLTQEQIDAGLDRLREMEVLELHAEIWQDRDTYNARGAADRTELCGGRGARRCCLARTMERVQLPSCRSSRSRSLPVHVPTASGERIGVIQAPRRQRAATTADTLSR